jgi:hypothetical protein
VVSPGLDTQAEGHREHWNNHNRDAALAHDFLCT